MARKIATATVVVAAALGLMPASARAVDAFEIQVYEGDINDAGQAGLELHSNYTASGRKQAAFTGEVVPDGLLRLTLEPSYGVRPGWELGAYLQTATVTGDPGMHWAGFKLRSKFIAPAASTAPFVVGVNLELGRGVKALGTDDWDVEIRPIFAWTRGRFAVAFNPILGWAVTGDRHWAPEFEPALKARAEVAHRVALGLEYYAGLGPLSSPAAWHDQEQYLYAAADLLGGPIELNVGVGHGLTEASQSWIIKTIVGKTF